MQFILNNKYIHTRLPTTNKTILLAAIRNEQVQIQTKRADFPYLGYFTEYSAVIELLQDAISHGVLSLEVCLDSQLVVSQLNGLYRIRDTTLLRRCLCVRLLERQFDNITYIHVSRIFNQVADSYDNYVLNWFPSPQIMTTWESI